MPNAHSGHIHPIVGLGLGDQLLHVAVGNDRQALSRIGRRSDTISFVTSKPRRPDQARHGTEFVSRKKAG